LPIPISPVKKVIPSRVFLFSNSVRLEKISGRGPLERRSRILSEIARSRSLATACETLFHSNGRSLRRLDFLTSFSGRTLRHGPTILERVFPILNGGEMAVVYCLVFFFIVFYGPGRWSIDFLLKKNNQV